MAQGEEAKKELAVELVELFLAAAQRGIVLRVPAGELFADALVLHPLDDRKIKIDQLMPRFCPVLVCKIFRDVVHQVVVSGDRRREYDARVPAHVLLQPPVEGKDAAGGGVLVVLHERDARIVERAQAGGDCELGGDVERFGEVLVHSVLALEIEAAHAAGELHDLGQVVDRVEMRVPVTLHEPDDVLVEHALHDLVGKGIDHVLPVQDPLEAVVEHPVPGPGHPDRDAGDHDALEIDVVFLDQASIVIRAPEFLFHERRAPARIFLDHAFDDALLFFMKIAAGKVRTVIDRPDPRLFRRRLGIVRPAACACSRQ